MKNDQLKSLPDDTDEWIRLLQTDDGRAAREHLAAGMPIYYRETDTPAGVCIKKFPDGHREWVTFDRRTGLESVIRTLNENDPTPPLAAALAQQGDDVGLDFGAASVQLDDLTEGGLVEDAVDETDLDQRLDEVAASTQKANEALDDALSFIAASNLRIDKVRGKPDEG
ncbi:hypothetical protein AWB74_01711 [Caballeronia arvi]|uniref:Uncharacterized protein n=1 Tax=Caballeronia arvi TaxID=1777135 RepID=A0A158HEW0_9BURK|nr:hypothetical protein [Caballeronia arvi]SAL42190.1 hypothetical protein AWB74_01711 [Caballeronia arvi]